MLVKYLFLHIRYMAVLFMAALLFLSPPDCRAETAVKHLVSIDFSYTLGGILNHGWGIGINGEQKIMDYFSAKGTFGHMTFLTAIENVYCTSVNLSLFANYYPLGKGLDKLYIGMGGGCDFMNYFGGGELPDTTRDTLIHIRGPLKTSVFRGLLTPGENRLTLILYITKSCGFLQGTSKNPTGVFRGAHNAKTGVEVQGFKFPADRCLYRVQACYYGQRKLPGNAKVCKRRAPIRPGVSFAARRYF